MKNSITQKIALTALAFLALSSCQNAAPNSAGPLAGNIIGGTNVTAQAQSTDGVVGLLMVGLNAQGKQTEAICTGSLISKNVVLSAGHCVMSTPDMQLKAIFVIFAPDIKSVVPEITQKNLVHVRKADAVIQHEGFGFDKLTKFVLNDLSLIRFQGEAPEGFQLAQIPTAQEFASLQVGTNLTLEGFGVSSYSLDPATQQPVGSGAGTLRQIDNRAISQFADDKSKIILSQTDNRGACHGDSGGPAYYTDTTTQQKYLVGVTSQAYNLKGNTANPLCDQLNVYTNIGSYLDWIQTNLAKIEAQ